MTVVATLDIADLGALRALRTRLQDRPGLRRANSGIAAPLGVGRLPRPMIGRVGVIAFWDDAAAAATRPTALLDGLHTLLEPIRIYGSWAGGPGDLTHSREPRHEGQAVVLTLGRFRIPRAPAFFRTSMKAEASLRDAPGVTWATGLAKPFHHESAFIRFRPLTLEGSLGGRNPLPSLG